MNLVKGNWVREQVTTVGTGVSLTLTMLSGFARVQDIPTLLLGDSVRYMIADGLNREAGIGTITAAGTFDRTAPQKTLIGGVYNASTATNITLSGNSRLYLAAADDDWDALFLDSITATTQSSWLAVHDDNNSTGTVLLSSVTDNLDGTIAVPAGAGYMRKIDGDSTPLHTVAWLAVPSLVLTDLATNYVYLEYNAGSPQIIASTVRPTDLNTNIMLGAVTRSGINLTIRTQDSIRVSALATRAISRLLETHPLALSSGAVISEISTRYLGISVGLWWYGMERLVTPLIDTNATSTFSYWYKDGIGGFIEVAGSTQIDNTQYDDNSGSLANLGNNNRYGIHWLYMAADGGVNVVYGYDNYKDTEYDRASPPIDVPQIVKDSILLARIVIQRNAANILSIVTMV